MGQTLADLFNEALQAIRSKARPLVDPQGAVQHQAEQIRADNLAQLGMPPEQYAGPQPQEANKLELPWFTPDPAGPASQAGDIIPLISAGLRKLMAKYGKKIETAEDLRKMLKLDDIHREINWDTIDTVSPVGPYDPNSPAGIIRDRIPNLESIDDYEHMLDRVFNVLDRRNPEAGMHQIPVEDREMFIQSLMPDVDFKELRKLADLKYEEMQKTLAKQWTEWISERKAIRESKNVVKFPGVEKIPKQIVGKATEFSPEMEKIISRLSSKNDSSVAPHLRIDFTDDIGKEYLKEFRDIDEWYKSADPKVVEEMKKTLRSNVGFLTRGSSAMGLLDTWLIEAAYENIRNTKVKSAMKKWFRQTDSISMRVFVQRFLPDIDMSLYDRIGQIRERQQRFIHRLGHEKGNDELYKRALKISTDWEKKLPDMTQDELRTLVEHGEEIEKRLGPINLSPESWTPPPPKGPRQDKLPFEEDIFKDKDPWDYSDFDPLED